MTARKARRPRRSAGRKHVVSPATKLIEWWRGVADALSAMAPVPWEVTAETITDDQLLDLGRSCLEGTASQAITRHLVIVALGLTLSSAEEVARAREHCATAWNARHGGTP